MTQFLLNGTEFRPSNYSVNVVIAGAELEAADGTPTLLVRSRKSLWEIKWEKVTWTTVLAVGGLFYLNTTFALQEADGGTATVQNTKDGFTYEIAIPSPVRRYNVTLKVRQA